MSKTTDRIEQAITPCVNSLGYRIVDVEIAKEYGNKVLTVFISHPDGISLDDCEKVSRAIDSILDELDPIAESYCLSVSSPGIDRPLKRPDDFCNALGLNVEVRLYQPIDGKKSYIGTISAYDETADVVTIHTEDQMVVRFSRKDASRVKPLVSL